MADAAYLEDLFGLDGKRAAVIGGGGGKGVFTGRRAAHPVHADRDPGLLQHARQLAALIGKGY